MVLGLWDFFYFVFWGNADSIAESDFTRIFIHSFVITFLK